MRGWTHVCIVGGLSAWLSAFAQTLPPQAPLPQPPPGTVPTPLELAPKQAPPSLDSPELPHRTLPRELGKPDKDVTIDVTRYEVDDDAPIRSVQFSSFIIQ